ncbi:MAG: DUF362 domain-containing protein [Candidatus Stygibacter frigidus]|nr:DUF362 domain-containing protein [Candidatus Stygibacter frigidus]
MKVFIQKIKEYDLPAISKFIENVFFELKLEEKLQNCQTVLLKPNLLGPYAPERAVTTNPTVVEAVIIILQTMGKDVWLGDSPGGSLPVNITWQKTGMQELCEKYHVKMINFNTEGIVNKSIENREYNIAQAFQEADAVIDLAKYKTHSLMYYTGCIKNLFGLIPGLKKSDYHSKYPTQTDFSQVICDIYQLSRKQVVLNILDGIVGMEGDGPSAGETRNFGIMMASESGAALDTQAAAMMGFKAEQISYISQCLVEEGISENEIDYDLQWKKFTFKDVKIKKVSQLIKFIQYSPKFLQDIFRNLFNYYPDFNTKCRLCGVCRDSCPVQAITISPHKSTPEIDYNKCIKCMCCHELCPYQAVYIHKSFLASLILK